MWPVVASISCAERSAGNLSRALPVLRVGTTLIHLDSAISRRKNQRPRVGKLTGLEKDDSCSDATRRSSQKQRTQSSPKGEGGNKTAFAIGSHYCKDFKEQGRPEAGCGELRIIKKGKHPRGEVQRGDMLPTGGSSRFLSFDFCRAVERRRRVGSSVSTAVRSERRRVMDVIPSSDIPLRQRWMLKRSV